MMLNTKEEYIEHIAEQSNKTVEEVEATLKEERLEIIQCADDCDFEYCTGWMSRRIKS